MMARYIVINKETRVIENAIEWGGETEIDLGELVEIIKSDSGQMGEIITPEGD